MPTIGKNPTPVPRARLESDLAGYPREGPLRFLLKLVREQGDIARYENSYGPVYFFNHPDQVQSVLQSTNYVRTSLVSLLLGDGLLASEGEYWRSQRRLMQPHFHERCVQGFGPMITDATHGMLKKWQEATASGATIDLSKEMRLLTLMIILNVLFGHVAEEDVRGISDALKILMQDLGDISDMVFNVPVDFSPSRNARFREALRTLDQIVLRMMENRSAAAGDPHDLLAALLNAERDVAGRALTRKQVRDEVVTMIVAGHETTAISLTWAFHLLCQNPGVEQRLDHELRVALGGRSPRVEDLSRMEYVRMVLEEAMRLYPPVSIVARQAIAEAEVGGVVIPAKSVLVLSAYTTHRHPQFWKDPESFDPDRFSPERSGKRHRFAYFPFLAGRHQCLGQPLAMMEGQLILAQVAQRCRFHALAGHPVEPLPGLALRLKEGFPVKLEMRQTTPLG